MNENRLSYVVRNADCRVCTRETAVNNEEKCDSDKIVEIFVTVVIAAVDAAIVKSSGIEKKRKVLQWDTNCDAVVIERKRFRRFC